MTVICANWIMCTMLKYYYFFEHCVRRSQFPFLFNIKKPWCLILNFYWIKPVTYQIPRLRSCPGKGHRWVVRKLPQTTSRLMENLIPIFNNVGLVFIIKCLGWCSICLPGETFPGLEERLLFLLTSEPWNIIQLYDWYKFIDICTFVKLFSFSLYINDFYLHDLRCCR